jgi:hypothetical protein
MSRNETYDSHHGDKDSGGGERSGIKSKLDKVMYRSNTRDAGTSYFRTTTAIVDYVGVEFGQDMRQLVKQNIDKTFTASDEPKKPDDKASQADLNRYDKQLTSFYNDKKQYNRDKSKVFAIILSKCSQELRNQVELSSGFDRLDVSSDVIGLMELIKEKIFTGNDKKHPCVALIEVLKQLAAINQGPQESTANYYKRFEALTTVFEEKWGDGYPGGDKS